MRKSLVAGLAVLTAFAVIGCGSSKPTVRDGYFSRQTSHGKPCPELPNGTFLCNTKVTRGDRRSRFTVLVVDVTPDSPSGFAHMNYSVIATATKPTQSQALQIANQVAHGHSVVVKHVNCRPASSGWACQYIR